MGLFSKKPKIEGSTEFVPSEDLGIDVVQAGVAAGTAGDVDAVHDLVASAASLDDAHAALVAVAQHAPLSAVRSWHDSRREEPLACVVYAEALVLAAWKARGHGMAETVGATQFDDFFAYLKAADQALRPALPPWDGAPLALATSVLLARGLQQRLDELGARYLRGVDLGGGTFLRLHEQALQGICAKWSGSHDMMFGFARDHLDTSAPSALNELVCIAHLEFWVSGDAPFRYFRKKEVAQEVAAAAATSWMPGFPDDYAGRSARSTFALTSYLSGDHPEAARQIHELGSSIKEFPWDYIGNPGRVIAELRATTV